MARYRNKPIEVDAEQWFPGRQVRGVYGAFEGQRRGTAALPEGSYPFNGPCVITIHGHVTPIDPGDWIIAEPDGLHFYPCKPDIFDRKYEPYPSTTGG